MMMGVSRNLTVTPHPFQLRFCSQGLFVQQIMGPSTLPGIEISWEEANALEP